MLVVEIDYIQPLDQTAVDVLRIISVLLGQQTSGFVDYNLIASIMTDNNGGKVERDTVRKAVNRMIKKGVLKKEDGKLSIQKAHYLNQT